MLNEIILHYNIYHCSGKAFRSKMGINRDDKIHSTSTITIQNTYENVGQDSAFKEADATLTVYVNPSDAKDASVDIIKKSKILFNKGSKLTDPIMPDSLGTWTAPFSIKLNTGNIYILITNKKGFRKEITDLTLDNIMEREITIDLQSLQEIQHKQKYWRTIKWISAAVSIGAGLATYYYDKKINTLKNEYDNSASSEVILAKREKIDSNKSMYKLFSGIALTGLTAVAVSWVVEINI